MDMFCLTQRHQPAVNINLHRMGPWDSPQKHTQSWVAVLTRNRVPESATAVVSHRPTLYALGRVYHTSPTDTLLTLWVLLASGHSHRRHSACPGKDSPDLVPLENADRMKDTQQFTPLACIHAWRKEWMYSEVKQSPRWSGHHPDINSAFLASEMLSTRIQAWPKISKAFDKRFPTLVPWNSWRKSLTTQAFGKMSHEYRRAFFLG